MPYADPRDPRILRNDDGEMIGPNGAWIDPQREGGFSGSSSGSDSPVPFILLVIGAILCVIEKLGHALPAWLLFVITLATSWGTAAIVGRLVRRSLGRTSKAVPVFKVLAFAAVAVLLGSLFCDFNGLGGRMLWYYTFIAIGLFVLGLLALLIGKIVAHPIRSAVIVLVGGWLFWVLFIAPGGSPQTAPSTQQSPPHPAPATVHRHKAPAKASHTTTTAQEPSQR